MLIKRKRGWEMRESEATPEAVFHDRRRVVAAIWSIRRNSRYRDG